MLLTLLYFIVALLLLIVFHEFGHFIVARLCGVKVLRFSFGFGKVLFSRYDKKGTEYAWSMLPFGGYIKMLDEEEGAVSEAEKHLAFNRQSMRIRLMIILAGPLFNFLFAFLALWLVAVIGVHSLAPIIGEVLPETAAAYAGLQPKDEIIGFEGQNIASWRDFQFALMPYAGTQGSVHLEVKSTDNLSKPMKLSLKNWSLDNKNSDLLKSLGLVPFIPAIPPVIGSVMEETPAYAAGFKKGDKVLGMNGQPINDWLFLVEYVQKNPGKSLTLTVMRENHQKNIHVIIGEKQTKGQSGGYLGLLSEKFEWPQNWLRHQRQDPWTGMLTAGKQTLTWIGATFVLTGRLITGRLDYKNLSGPVGIAEGAGASGRQGFTSYFTFLAIVSISLGVLNLLPIPMLDGGYLLFYLLESLMGRPINETTRMLAFYGGLVLILTVTLFALHNDISRITG